MNTCFVSLVYFVVSYCLFFKTLHVRWSARISILRVSLIHLARHWQTVFSISLSICFPISFPDVVMKPGGDDCLPPLKAPEEDEEVKQEATAMAAAAEWMSGFLW